LKIWQLGRKAHRPADRVQVVVHLRYFLHIDLQSTPRENLLALGFAAVLPA
jgi:heme/copper-type cytochrome/quinol oxidase subunit 4